MPAEVSRDGIVREIPYLDPLLNLSRLKSGCLRQFTS